MGQEKVSPNFVQTSPLIFKDARPCFFDISGSCVVTGAKQATYLHDERQYRDHARACVKTRVSYHPSPITYLFISLPSPLPFPLLQCNNTGFTDPSSTLGWSVVDFDWVSYKARVEEHTLCSFSFLTVLCGSSFYKLSSGLSL